MRAFSRLFWRQRKPAESPPFFSRHRLDLKQGFGNLKGLYMDLPERAQDPDASYLRRTESWFVPPSYRTGLALVTTVMILSMSTVTLMGTQSRAESKQDFLSAQILTGIEELTQENKYLRSHDGEGYLLLEEQEEFIVAEDPLRSLLQSEDINEHQELVQLNSSMSKGFRSFDRFIENWSAISEQAVIPQMNWMHIAAQQALQAWKLVLAQAHRLDIASFPDQHQAPLLESLELVSELSHVLKSYDQSYDHLIRALGAEEPQRILVFIQDSYRQRAAGGALSAGVELLLENAEVLAWRPFHTEDYDDQLRIQLQAPNVVKALSENWDMETANAFVDVERSAEQIHWFWQREARSSADLIILVSSEALERVLNHEATTNFIDAEKRSQIESFALRWSALAAVNEKEGLKALANLSLNAFTELLKNPDVMIQLHPSLRREFVKQQVSVYSSHPDQQKIFREQQVAGSVPSLQAQEDVLMLSSINQREEMTDRWREDDYELHTSIEADGKIKHWLHLSRRHMNVAQSYSADIDPVLVRNMRGQTHRSLLQVMVPFGSELISIDGVKQTDIQVTDHEAFRTWTFPVEVSAGGLVEVALSYELPWQFDTTTVDNYRLHLLKQSGSKSVGFSHHLKLPADMAIFQQLPEQPIMELDRNQVIAIVAGKNP